MESNKKPRGRPKKRRNIRGTPLKPEDSIPIDKNQKQEIDKTIEREDTMMNPKFVEYLEETLATIYNEIKQTDVEWLNLSYIVEQKYKKEEDEVECKVSTKDNLNEIKARMEAIDNDFINLVGDKLPYLNLKPPEQQNISLAEVESDSD